MKYVATTLEGLLQDAYAPDEPDPQYVALQLQHPNDYLNTTVIPDGYPSDVFPLIDRAHKLNAMGFRCIQIKSYHGR